MLKPAAMMYVGNLELGLYSMHGRLDVGSEGQDVEVLLIQ